jgi:hypothetical protein
VPWPPLGYGTPIFSELRALHDRTDLVLSGPSAAAAYDLGLVGSDAVDAYSATEGSLPWRRLPSICAPMPTRALLASVLMSSSASAAAGPTGGLERRWVSLLTGAIGCGSVGWCGSWVRGSAAGSSERECLYVVGEFHGHYRMSGWCAYPRKLRG